MMQKVHDVIITPEKVVVDGKNLPVTVSGVELLKEVYRNNVGDYPKFYKMDILCKLGFIASELLIVAEGKERFTECDDRAIILFGNNASICSDRDYQATISNASDFFPSPALFVYTLPNIVTGEIAMRNKYYGETSYMICDDSTQIDKYIEIILNTSDNIKSAVCGWVDARSDSDFEAKMWIVEK